MNTENYNLMLKSRPFIDEVKWQKTALFLEDIWDKNKVVLAAGTSSGKTFFTIMYLNMFYKLSENSSKKTLIIPSSQTNLLKNFVDNLKDFGPDFSYKVARTGEELQEAMNSNVQVIVCLPQTVIRSLEHLPKLDKLILDEAHTWYFKKTIKSIIKKTKPTQQLLLTGTPAPFVLRGGFFIHFVPVMDLYDEGRIAKTEIHIVSSNYDFKNEDYNINHNLTLNSKVKMALASEDSFRKVILGMIKKLKNPIKGMKNINRLTNEAGGLFFNHLDKTIIWASSISQANKFASVLRTFNGLENGVLVSHSENDDDSQLMDKFKKDKSIKVLVSVNRGRMGWSYTELYNAVDFTMTRNLSSILQMIARLFRISKIDPSSMKYFYKVSNAKDAGYYTVIMKGVLLLLDREWYSKFNGKNFNGMEIPVTVPRKPRTDPNTPSTGRPRTNYKYEMLDLPLDTDFFRTVYAKQDDPFSSVAWTTIGKVRQDLLGIAKRGDLITEKEIAKEVKKYSLSRDLWAENQRIAHAITYKNLEEKYSVNFKDWVYRKARKNKDKEFFIKILKPHKGKSVTEVINSFKPLYVENNKEYYGGRWIVYTAQYLGINLEDLGIGKNINSRKYKTKEEVFALAKQCTSMKELCSKLGYSNLGSMSGWCSANNVDKSVLKGTLKGKKHYDDIIKDIQKYDSYREWKTTNPYDYKVLMAKKELSIPKKHFNYKQ